jgi:hypothetical protein
MNAPLLIKIEKEDLETIKYDALKIAEVELESGILPISIHRPMPDKKEAELKKVKIPQLNDKEIEEKESQEEEEIAKEGEIMELAKPEDELDEDSPNETGGEIE